MTVRPAAPDDVELVTTLERRLFGGDAWSADQVREELTGPHRRAWIADDVGYAVTMHLGAHADVVDLHRIGVDPDHRRRGVGHALLEAATEAAGPGRRMLLEVSADNAGALGFCAAEGFSEITRRPGYYRDGSDAVVMERMLDD
jgi:[ribosomal protein S18]-alanine N-acetyltransferase